MRNKEKIAIALLFNLVLMVFVFPVLSKATTIDVWQNFPDNQGDKGFYTYGYAPATDTYRLLADNGNYCFSTPATKWGAPAMGKYSDSKIHLWFSGTYSNTGHPEDAVLAWIAQETASYQVDGTFSVSGSSGNGMDAYIKYNDTTLWSSYMSPGATEYFNVASFDLNAGDVIYFGVGAHNNNSFSELNDGARLFNTQIIYDPLNQQTPVPEPATMILFSTGLVGLVGSKFRRKKNSSQ